MLALVSLQHHLSIKHCFKTSGNSLPMVGACLFLTLICLTSQGRIRGTYGINAKPVVTEIPAESPPTPGVTRASLRPKPTAKASPDDEEVEGVKPSAGLRHLRAISSGPDAGAAQDSPSSPPHTKTSAPEGQSQLTLLWILCQ